MATKPHRSQRDRHSEQHIEIANLAAISQHSSITPTLKPATPAQEINMVVKHNGAATRPARQPAVQTTAKTVTPTAPKALETNVSEPTTAPAAQQQATQLNADETNAVLTAAVPEPEAVVAIEAAVESDVSVSASTGKNGKVILHVQVPADETVKVKMHKAKSPKPEGNPFKRLVATMADATGFIKATLSASEEAEINRRVTLQLDDMVNDPKGKRAAARADAEKRQAKQERKLLRKAGVTEADLVATA